MLVVMVGVPGAGKSTYAAANFRHIVSPDRIRMEEHGVRFDPAVEPAVWRDAYARAGEGLARRRVVCFDATSVTRRRRRKLIALAREVGVPAVAVWLRTPLETAWTRNVEREATVPRPAFRRLADRLEPPTTEEGFAAVLSVPGAEG